MANNYIIFTILIIFLIVPFQTIDCLKSKLSKRGILEVPLNCEHFDHNDRCIRLKKYLSTFDPEHLNKKILRPYPKHKLIKHIKDVMNDASHSLWLKEKFENSLKNISY
ncbi:hypothetical protein FF38_05474, partial [Lucilia cuprina]